MNISAVRFLFHNLPATFPFTPNLSYPHEALSILASIFYTEFAVKFIFPFHFILQQVLFESMLPVLCTVRKLLPNFAGWNQDAAKSWGEQVVRSLWTNALDYSPDIHRGSLLIEGEFYCDLKAT